MGLMSSFEALKQARGRGLDLVEIHEKSQPPICKIMDYGKWKFETKKKEKQNKKKQVKILIKEIQMRPRTDEGDIKIKLEKAKEFFKQGHKVKINIRFFGREMAHKELGFKLLKQVEDRLSDLAFPETPAKMERRALFAILAPHSHFSPKKTAPAKEPASPHKPEVSRKISLSPPLSKPAPPAAVAPAEALPNKPLPKNNPDKS